MKIVHINAYGRWSTGNIAGEILQNLPSNYEKYLIYNLGDSDYSFSVKYENKFEYLFHKILTRLTGISGTNASYFNTIKIIHHLKKIHPDIIHLHNLHEFSINCSMLFSYIKKHNIRTIITLHDCWNFTGGCTHYDYIKCDKWKTKCKDCPQAHFGNLRSITPIYLCSKNFISKQRVFLGVKNLTIVCPSKWLASEVKQSFLKDYPIEVINNGINLDNFNITDNHNYDDIIDRKKKIILAVASSWKERKGYKDLFKINKLLSKDYQLVVVGVNECQQQELEGASIVAIQRTSNQIELAELYSIASVFVNTTYEEVLGMVNIEALACGCPIITYNTGGSVEVIEDNNGIIVPQGNVEALVEAIPNAIKLKENSIEFIEKTKQKYSAKNMANQYIELYNRQG